MKTKLLIIAVVSTLVSACTTGTHLARTYDDDIYFSPGDVPPVSMATDEGPAKASNSYAGNKRIVMSQKEKNSDGTSTRNNYIFQPGDSARSSDRQAYNMDQQKLAESDTTAYYNDDSVKYVINNYYDGNDNDMDFSNRINRFHNPYYYDPFFYNDWNYGFNSPYYSGYYGGYDPWFSGGWGYPYSYGYYSPFAIGLGFGGYWGGGYGGYYGGGYDGYYGGGYGGGYYGGSGGGFYNNHDVARRRSTEMNMPSRDDQNNVNKSGRAVSSLRRDGNYGNSSDSRLPNGISTGSENSRSRSTSINASGNNGDTKNGTIVNNRRVSGTSSSQVQGGNNPRSLSVRPGSSTSGNTRRSYQPSTTGRTYDQNRVATQGQNYTPSYNKPRIVNQSNFNNNNGYTRPSTSSGTSERGVIKSANTNSGQGYSAPRSSSNMRQTYRSNSSYSTGSSNSSRSSGSGYSSPSNSGSTYSAPERSSSSSGGGGSYNSGSSGSSSGSSSGGSSGGSGGRSGSGGRR